MLFELESMARHQEKCPNLLSAKNRWVKRALAHGGLREHREEHANRQASEDGTDDQRTPQERSNAVEGAMDRSQGKIQQNLLPTAHEEHFLRFPKAHKELFVRPALARRASKTSISYLKRIPVIRRRVGIAKGLRWNRKRGHSGRGVIRLEPQRVFESNESV